eukprot:scaffold14168_cov64-Phaeocystis_antarctica.AAC.5
MSSNVQSLRGRPLAASCLAPPRAVSCVSHRCRGAGPPGAGRVGGAPPGSTSHMDMRHMPIAMPCARNLHGA